MKVVDIIHNTLQWPFYNTPLFKKFGVKGVGCFYGRRWHREGDLVVIEF